MTRKEKISLILLALVIMIGIYKFVTAEYEFVDSKYLNYAPDVQGKNLRTEIYVRSDKKSVASMINNAFDYMQELIYRYSEDHSESIVYKINHAQGAKVAIDADFYELLEKSREMYELTKGSFDITIKPVLELWDFDCVDDPNDGDNTQYIPDSLLVQEKLKLVGFSQIEYDQEFIQMPAGMSITLGAISKGFIVDKVVDYLKENGALAGYVDQVSSIRYFGEIKKNIILGIQHPRKSSQVIAELTNLNETAIATSGDYQQYFDVDDIRFHHILDAKTGFPTHENVAVTIIAETAFMADALSTGLFLIDGDVAINYLRGIKNSDAIIYSDFYNEKNRIWEAISIKSEKTEWSKGIEYYLRNEYIDGE